VNIVDLVMGGYLFLGLLTGIGRGFATVLLRLGVWVGSVGVAATTWREAARVLDHSFNLTARCAAFLGRGLALPGEVAATKVAEVSLEPAARQGLLTSLSLPETLERILQSDVARFEGLARLMPVETVGDYVALNLAVVLVGALGFVAVLLLARLILGLLAALLAPLLANLFGPVVNRLGGAVLGAAISALILTLLIGLAAPLASFPLFRPLTVALEQSYLAPWFVALFDVIRPW